MYPGHAPPPSLVRMVDAQGRVVSVDTDSLPPAVAYQCMGESAMQAQPQAQHAMQAAPATVAVAPNSFSRPSPPPPATTVPAPAPAPSAPSAHPSHIAAAGRTCVHWTLRFFLPLIAAVMLLLGIIFTFALGYDSGWVLLYNGAGLSGLAILLFFGPRCIDRVSRDRHPEAYQPALVPYQQA